jgi:SAM-dependent methyltransferase
MSTAISCPLCGSQHTHVIFQRTGWRILACDGCTNAFTDPPPDLTQLDYAADDFHGQKSDLRDLPIAWQRAIQQQVALLQKHLAPSARILEIGCGRGMLLAALKERGFEVQGIEPSHTAAEVAQARGLNVVRDYFPSPHVHRTFDAVIMTHVLEHLPDSRAILSEVSKVAPGGVLLLVQTNWRGAMPSLLNTANKQWYAWMPTQHFWHFTPKGLDSVTTPLGFMRMAVDWSMLDYSAHAALHSGAQVIDRVGTVVPTLRDQFHYLARIPQTTTVTTS